MLVTLFAGGKPMQSSGAGIKSADEDRRSIYLLKRRQNLRIQTWYRVGLKEKPSNVFVCAADATEALLIDNYFTSAAGLVA